MSPAGPPIASLRFRTGGLVKHRESLTERLRRGAEGLGGRDLLTCAHVNAGATPGDAPGRLEAPGEEDGKARARDAESGAWWGKGPPLRARRHAGRRDRRRKAAVAGRRPAVIPRAESGSQVSLLHYLPRLLDPISWLVVSAFLVLLGPVLVLAGHELSIDRVESFGKALCVPLGAVGLFTSFVTAALVARLVWSRN